MNQTRLEFEIISSKSHIMAFDCSIYNPDIPVTNPQIGIIPPNFSTRYVKDYTPLSRVSITAQDIYGTNCPLSDGVYTLDFSVCPNDQVFIKINYLRNYNLRNKILTFSEGKRNDEESLKDLLYLEAAAELIRRGGSEDCEKGILIFNTLNDKYNGMY